MARKFSAGTSLHRAAAYFALALLPDEEADQAAVAEVLLANGAYVNAKDNGGKTPLSIAEENKQQALAQALHKHGGTK